MIVVKLDTGFNIEVEFPITQFHRRLLAWVIDIFVMFAYVQIVAKVFDIPAFFIWFVNFGTWSWVVATLPVALYHLLMEIFLNGQSIGKQIMKTKVITLEGGQPSVSQYMIRWMFRMVDFGLLFLPAFFCVILTPRSQRVGDLIAGTIVIDTNAKTTWQDTIFTEISSTYKPKYSQVMQLSDRDINTLKSIIGSVKKRNDYELAHRISERIQSKLNIQAEEDSLHFLEILLKDYNYYSTNN
ncbi:MAG TPA: RDD family protein [Chitinophagaceae bacterium]|nr:RDD family protein [Chitinophagaceae bacterium]